MDWLARGGRAHATALRTHGRARRQRLARTWLRGCRCTVAFELRYAAGRLQQRARPFVGTTQAALFIPARVRTRPARQKIWPASRSAKWTDPRALTRQHLGTGMEQHLPADGFAQAGAKLRSHQNPAGTQN